MNEGGHLYGVHGSSGGYAETIFRHAAGKLYGREIKGPLEFKTIRNSDFQEVTLEVSSVHPYVLFMLFHQFYKFMNQIIFTTQFNYFAAGRW